MEIIDFPGSAPKAIQISDHKLSVGPLKFSCDCGSVAHLSFSGTIIYRYIDFYCSSCGTNYKITNPAFKRPEPTRPGKAK